MSRSQYAQRRAATILGLHQPGQHGSARRALKAGQNAEPVAHLRHVFPLRRSHARIVGAPDVRAHAPDAHKGFAWVAAGALALLGCKAEPAAERPSQAATHREEAPAPRPAKPPAEVPLPTSEPAKPSVHEADDELPTQAQLPVAEDFEREVTTEIHSKNYRAELEEIERELRTERP